VEERAEVSSVGIEVQEKLHGFAVEFVGEQMREF